MTDFIYRKENVLSSNFCKSLIELFEIDKERQHRGVVRVKGEVVATTNQKTSTDISFTPKDLEDKLWGNSLKKVIPIVDKARLDWINQYYMGLDKIDPFEINFTFNMQRFLPGEGYHAFHCEKDSSKYDKRCLTWMVYLNDVNEGGETEWLYQQLKVKPKRGTVVIWPTGFTHLHRGNPPMSNKYIVTGWFSSNYDGDEMKFYKYEDSKGALKFT